MVLRAVLSEAVLRREVGGPDVMREQVARLREATSRPNIAVQILPFSAGAHPGMTGPFTRNEAAWTGTGSVVDELIAGAVAVCDLPARVRHRMLNFTMYNICSGGR